MLCKIFVVSYLLVLCVVTAVKYEGDSCTEGGETGTCIKITQCPSSIKNIKRKNPQICGFNGTTPIVCCVANDSDSPTLSAPVSTTTEPSLSKEETKEEGESDIRFGAGGCLPILAATANYTGQKAFDKCIEYQERFVYPCGHSVALTSSLARSNNCHHNADQLIIGGTAAAKYEFPHMVIVVFEHDEISAQAFCGGAVISENFVLTAAHCSSTRLRINVTHVIVGALRRSEAEDQNKYAVKRIIVHPGYQSPIKYDDIALLETVEKMPLSQYLVPACLHTGDPVDDKEVLATGWGRTTRNSAESVSDILQKVILEKYPDEECKELFGSPRLLDKGVDTETQVCYGHKKEAVDTCWGDSGGPIVIKDKKIHCMYTIVGVTSSGSRCGVAGEPGLYSRVAHYVPWIESIVWP